MKGSQNVQLIFIYNTEDERNVEAYDCVYYQDKLSDLFVPFCRRDGDLKSRSRKNETCAPDSTTHRFSELREQNVSMEEILQWSSSIEVADGYGKFLNNSKHPTDEILCECKKPNTFGKYCEYELYFHSNIQNDLDEQLKQKGLFLNIHKEQMYGHTLCYTTLKCDSGLLCLDYRNICDGRQQCTDGWDEENCDLLEFNECEEEEYRCLNGMCIPEEFFLDGQQDCMDHSDEQVKSPTNCRLTFSSFHCDEHLCYRNQFSCGDGKCIPYVFRTPFQQINALNDQCDTYREYLYQCELSRSLPLWTNKQGRCLAFTAYNVNIDEINDFNYWSQDRQCIWLIKCALVFRRAPWCPCFGNDCKEFINKICSSAWIIYPRGRLLNILTYTMYARNHTNWYDTQPESFFLLGSLRCRGFHLTFNQENITSFSMNDEFIRMFQYDFSWCNFNQDLTHQNQSMYAPHFHQDCYHNESNFLGKPSTFDDVCEISRECISDHRLLDRMIDCYDSLDEIIGNRSIPKCLSNKHRFQCSSEQPTCYLAKELYFKRTAGCFNYHDMLFYGTGIAFSTLRCTIGDQEACRTIRLYIENHDRIIPSETVIPYIYYCDALWDTTTKIDELPIGCQQWICLPGQYQCLSGQCIHASYICDQSWDCPDGSDEQGIFIIQHFSDHNRQYFNLKNLKSKCQIKHSKEHYPFNNICNLTWEYPCLLANVSNPLDIQTNRPCIPIAKIGDHIVDCYGGLDERMHRRSCSVERLPQDFDFHCLNSSIKQCIPYEFLCKKRCAGDEPLCFHQQNRLNQSCSGKHDVLCFDGTCRKDARCNQRAECTYGEDEYWCAEVNAVFTLRNRLMKDLLRSLAERPLPLLIVNRQFERKSIPDNELSACNRGMALQQYGNLVCLCPPNYYGQNCEFYSDRLTCLIKFNGIEIQTMYLVAILFYNEDIIDMFKTYIYSSSRQRFYFVYSRSNSYLKNKQERYFNRSNIIHFHPYHVQFELYEFKENSHIQLKSIWNYPIYFDFLPSFRFSKILRFETYNNACLSNPCSNNSTCFPILNTNTSFICHCQNGFYGKTCEQFFDICISYCHSSAICKRNCRGIINGINQPLCICPRNHFGPTCHIHYNVCQSQPCENHGICYQKYNPAGIDMYACQCTDRFYGKHCQYSKPTIEIHLLNISYSPLKMIVRYYQIYSSTYRLRPQFQQIYSSIPIQFQYYHEYLQGPTLTLLILYEKYDHEPLYFILSFQHNSISINKTSSLEYHCSDVNDLSILANDLSVPNVYNYHKLCRSNSRLVCFHDSYYLCVCTADSNRAECFTFPSDSCSKCLSNGRCIEDVTVSSWKTPSFLCLCPRCYYGHVCEFSTLAFSFTLDSLITKDRFEMRFIYLFIVFMNFLLGLLNNVPCFSTFKRSNVRQFGTGNYLYIISILSQFSLSLLLLKFIHILLSSNNLLDNLQLMNIILCKSLSYLLSVSNRSIYWLLSLVTIDRLHLVLYPSIRKNRLHKTNKAIYFSLITILIIFGLHIHEVFYYTIVKDANNATLCVMNFATQSILTYDRVNVLLHSLCPFVIQILSVTSLIIFTTRGHAKVIKHENKYSFKELLTKQFLTQKELYITPIIIIFSNLPQLILTFSLACTELSFAWQRYILLIGYFLSLHTPIPLLFYHAYNVLESPIMLLAHLFGQQYFAPVSANLQIPPFCSQMLSSLSQEIFRALPDSHGLHWQL
ncbi:hypothetical protein I4U23_022845 [Adineta vaga]|nr:hypothetical protein I4U23_022845 [Adineta vaga]